MLYRFTASNLNKYETMDANGMALMGYFDFPELGGPVVNAGRIATEATVRIYGPEETAMFYYVHAGDGTHQFRMKGFGNDPYNGLLFDSEAEALQAMRDEQSRIDDEFNRIKQRQNE